MDRGSRGAPPLPGHSLQALTELLIDESHFFAHQLQLLPQELLAEGRDEPRPTFPAPSPGLLGLPRPHLPSPLPATGSSHRPGSFPGIRLHPHHPRPQNPFRSPRLHPPSPRPRPQPRLLSSPWGPSPHLPIYFLLPIWISPVLFSPPDFHSPPSLLRSCLPPQPTSSTFQLR